MPAARFTVVHQLLLLVGYFVLCFAGAVALQAAGAEIQVILALGAVGGGLAVIAGLRLARTMKRMLHENVTKRLTEGLYEVQLTAAHMAASQADAASDELSSQAQQVASIAGELLALTNGGKRPEHLVSTGGRRGTSHTDDISDFWELSNPH